MNNPSVLKKIFYRLRIIVIHIYDTKLVTFLTGALGLYFMIRGFNIFQDIADDGEKLVLKDWSIRVGSLNWNLNSFKEFLTKPLSQITNGRPIIGDIFKNVSGSILTYTAFLLPGVLSDLKVKFDKFGKSRAINFIKNMNKKDLAKKTEKYVGITLYKRIREMFLQDPLLKITPAIMQKEFNQVLQERGNLWGTTYFAEITNLENKSYAMNSGTYFNQYILPVFKEDYLPRLNKLILKATPSNGKLTLRQRLKKKLEK